MATLINKLAQFKHLTLDEWEELITQKDSINREELYELSEKTRRRYYGNKIFLRGLIEFSNFCKNNCYYCGIRRSNYNVKRYRLSKDEILECCHLGYKLGYRTFVLQSGEDFVYNTDLISDIVSSIKSFYPDCAITLSLGERDKEDYQAWFDSGADRYLLRHETAYFSHYKKLHPKEMSLENRMQCLVNLKKIGYQVGVGFMVGSPYQSPKTLASDMAFIERFNPHMVGIGPFIPHKDTPFRDKTAGSLNDTLFFLSLIRLTIPKVLLPATTALGTIHPLGRELGIKVGANVLMPNLSPKDVRKDYLLYDNKICTGDEAAECINCLSQRMKNINYEIVSERGDSLVNTPNYLSQNFNVKS